MRTGTLISIFTILLSFIFVLHVPSVPAEETLIGVVMTGNTSYYGEIHQAFTDALNSRLPQSEKVRILLQRPFPDPIALSNAARKLIAADVDIIVTYGSPATHAVIFEKSAIPVVYAGVYSPESSDIAGKNVVGCGFKVPLSSLLRYLKSLKQIATLSVLYSDLEEDSVRQVNELQILSQSQQITLNRINITSKRDIEKTAAGLISDACFITGSSIVNLLIEDFLAILKENRVPSAGILPDLQEAGIVVTLYQKPEEQGKKIAEMVSQIIMGSKPRDIQGETLMNTELVFNFREAKGIGLKIPIKLIAEASRVIK